MDSQAQKIFLDPEKIPQFGDIKRMSIRPAPGGGQEMKVAFTHNDKKEADSTMYTLDDISTELLKSHIQRYHANVGRAKRGEKLVFKDDFAAKEGDNDENNKKRRRGNRKKLKTEQSSEDGMKQGEVMIKDVVPVEEKKDGDEDVGDENDEEFEQEKARKGENNKKKNYSGAKKYCYAKVCLVERTGVNRGRRLRSTKGGCETKEAPCFHTFHPECVAGECRGCEIKNNLKQLVELNKESQEK